MTTWAEFSPWLSATMSATSPVANTLTFELPGHGGRGQVAMVSLRVDQEGAEWAEIFSPIGPLDDVDLIAAVIAVHGAAVGGLSSASDLVGIRHSVPLASMDLEEFDRPLRLVLTSADYLEQALLGRDEF